MTLSPDQFSRGVLETLSEDDRRSRLAELERDLTERLRSHQEWDDYWREVDRIITEMKAVGHDLWSHDYDGERRHLWGWDYMRPDTAGFLQIEFDHQGQVRTFWRTCDPRLGTAVDEDEVAE